MLLPNPSGIPVDICANDGVPLEPAAVDEALALLETAATLERLAEATPGYDGPTPRITRAALTPDLHKGAGIPIGTVLETEHALLPQAVGNDVNCGMRLEVTTLRADRVRPRLDALERRLRHLFFEGGRRIALTPAQREGLLRDGLPGLLLTGEPRWPGLRPEDAEDGLDRVHASGYPAGTAEAFADWIGGAGGASHDSVIGGIGGGNHFAELQYVARVHDAAAAHAWGLAPGTVVTMAHSGSLSLGHQANATALDRLRTAWPAGLPVPATGSCRSCWTSAPNRSGAGTSTRSATPPTSRSATGSSSRSRCAPGSPPSTATWRPGCCTTRPTTCSGGTATA